MKRKQRKSITILAFILIFLLIILFGGYKLYINIKCKDLYFAVEYQMTKNGSKNKLLRIQSLSLVFLDDDVAIVEVSGLNKEKPYFKTNYKAFFRKNNNSTWKLENSIPID